ncbi:MAG: hypothetical protein IJM30_02395 [Thermoguttaceae bacterium]|nr:hypothetical protein [Thermoguttaceae bacterium]
MIAIGTDEAGYGPNLGPLLVGISRWRIDAEEPEFATFMSDAPRAARDAKPKRRRKKSSDSSGPTLFALEFEEPEQIDLVSRAVDRLNDGLAPISGIKGAFPLVDSKKLYGGSKSLAALERSFWLARGIVVGSTPTRASFRSVLSDVALERAGGSEPPWERGVDFRLPLDPKTGDFSELEERFGTIRATLSEAGIALEETAARRVQALEFNALIDKLGLKSDLIAEATTSLVVESLGRANLRDSETRTVVALCDKLGGRDRYAPILRSRFPGSEPKALSESRSESRYRLIAERGLDREGAEVAFGKRLAIEFRFAAKGESNAPTALASICAKYLREVSMAALNDFWRTKVGDSLAPTAGYPVDAARFRSEVESSRRELGISDDEFWRKK